MSKHLGMVVAVIFNYATNSVVDFRL